MGVNLYWHTSFTPKATETKMFYLIGQVVALTNPEGKLVKLYNSLTRVNECFINFELNFGFLARAQA